MNVDLEKEILGSLCLKPELIKNLIVEEKHFIIPIDKKILTSLKKLFAETGTFNFALISSQLKEDKDCKLIIETLTEYVSDVIPPTTETFIKLQEQLHKKYINNEINKVITSYLKKEIDQDTMINKIIYLNNLSLVIKEDSLNADEIYNLITSKNKQINLKFQILSRYANVQEHDLVTIAARPGVGKTGFLLNLLEDLSSKFNCLFFNMEMTDKQVYSRLVSINSYVAMQDFMTDDLERKTKILASCNAIAEKKFKVFTGTQTISSIRNKIINESRDKHVIVFIDYVGLIFTESKENEYERLTFVMKELRKLTLDYDCTIFLASQLNRETNMKNPTISDLKGSGELEQSSSTVILLYEDLNSKVDENHSIITVAIGKNRNGKRGKILFNYFKNTQVFGERRS